MSQSNEYSSKHSLLGYNVFTPTINRQILKESYMPNVGPRFSTGREPVGTHEFTAKYDAKSAQPMNLANEPNSFPAACMQPACRRGGNRRRRLVAADYCAYLITFGSLSMSQ